MRGLSGFRLKIIAGVMLAFQVASTTVVPQFFGGSLESMTALSLAVICELVSWCAIPIYAWLLVAGYRHTSNQWRYMARLFGLGLLCEIPYDLVTFGSVANFDSQNPVFALALALLVLVLLDYVRRQVGAWKWFLAVLVAGAGILWALLLRLGVRQSLLPVGALLVAFALIFHLLEGRENTMMMSAGFLGALVLVAPAIGVAFLHYRNETKGYDNPRIGLMLYAIYPLELLAGVSVALLL